MRTLLAFLALSSAAAAQVTVTGTVRYQDRPYTDTGFTPGPAVFLPVRRAEIDLVQDGSNAVLVSGVTDDTGSFSLLYTGPPQLVRARIYARRTKGQINVAVFNNNAQNQLYSVLSGAINASTAAFPPIDVTNAVAAPVFNIFDCAVKSFQYLASASILPTLADTPPLLTIYWEPGSLLGSSFDRSIPAVFIHGENSDPDEYDDDMILHEIGHWVAFRFSKDDTLGGPHSVVDQLDPRTAWSEGWATYWSAAVRRYWNTLTPEYFAPNLFVNNFQVGNSVFDIEGPSYPDQAIGARNELAICAVLWDLSDTANEAFDTLSGHEADIWTVLSVKIPPRSQITLEDFHAEFIALLPGLETAVSGTPGLVRIFNDRQIRYYLDPSEANNSSGSPTTLAVGLAGLTLRTLWPANDQDWYQVNAGAGTLVLETLNLQDGADTKLELYDATGLTLLDSNDNRSPGDHSSLILRIVIAPTAFLIRVTATGGIVEYGTYDVRARTVTNGPPVINSLGASAISGVAPFRVTFDPSVSDSDASSLEYQWDFNGDGVVDWASLEGGKVTTTYDEPGVFLARLDVVDAGDFVVTSTVTITVTSPTSAGITFSNSPSGGTAPLTVSFGATVTGVTPAAYLWDFDGDGIFDSASVTTASASFTFRRPGTYTPRLVVRDSQGRATRRAAPAIVVAAGPTPPTVDSFTATGGTLPFASTFSVGHSDLGAGTVEFDVDGDGRYDVLVAPGSASGTVFAPPIARAGALTPRVRVTDAAGQSVTGSASFSSRSVGIAGLLVEPRDGDRLSGSAVTLSAQALPQGVSKSVQFQSQPAGGGAWTDIGTPIVSTGTLFSASWDVSGLTPLSSFNVRIWIDGVVSSGDTTTTVVIDSAAPTVVDDGAIRTRSLRTDRTTISRNQQGVWVLVPLGATADALPLTLQAATAPAANGSAASHAQTGLAWNLQFAGTFTGPFQLRLPFTGDGTPLEIHHYDAGASTWRRLGYARVSHADGWVEADVQAGGIYSLFAPQGGGDGCGLLGLEALALLLLARLVRRRSGIIL